MASSNVTNISGFNAYIEHNARSMANFVADVTDIFKDHLRYRLKIKLSYSLSWNYANKLDSCYKYLNMSGVNRADT